MTTLDLDGVPAPLAEVVSAGLAEHQALALHVGPRPPADQQRWWAVAPHGEEPESFARRLGEKPLPDAVLLADEAQRAAFEAAAAGDVGRRTWLASQDLRPLVAATFPDDPSLLTDGRRLRVLVAGHDVNFFARAVEHLQRLPQVDVVVDHVPVFARQDFARSRELLADRDVVWAEWLSPVAIWYSENVAPHQRLLVHAHRYELFNDWPSQLRIDRVAQVVCVSPEYTRVARERNPSWPAHKVVCIPNYVDVAHFDRPKHPSAPYTLGMLGVVPRLKRLDLALEVLRRLRRHDDRFHLIVRSRMPWDYAWNWRDAAEREAIGEILRRTQADPLLRDALTFDEHGPDVASWLRGVGWVLSTSDIESFHLAPAEGMASGAVPVIRRRLGADTVFHPRWLHDSPEDMADAIAAATADGRWSDLSAEAKRQARSFDLTGVLADIRRVLTTDLTAGDERPVYERAG